MKSLSGVAVLLVLSLAGQAFAEEPEKIVGGRPARQNEFPHQVSLRLNGHHLCGGTILSSTHVLTAAHCVYNNVLYPYNNFVVVTGSNMLSRGGQSHAVLRVVYHEAYEHSQQTSWRDDVAVITLKKPMSFNAAQRPIPLATKPPVPNTSAVVSGFGLTKVGGQVSEVLKTTPMRIVSRQECQQAHRTQPIYSTQICALYATGTGVCSGDSGGPLIQKGQVIGIVSWVLPCGLGYPDIFTNVYDYVDWIKAQMY